MKAFCVHQEKCFGSDLSSALLQMIDLYIYIVWFNIWYIEKHNNSSSLQTESVISCAVRSGAAARRGNRDISESLNAVLGTKTRMFKYEIKHCRLFNEQLWDRLEMQNLTHAFLKFKTRYFSYSCMNISVQFWWPHKYQEMTLNHISNEFVNPAG